jgi:membrane protease subunit (stomatin/prohibitin family)
VSVVFVAMKAFLNQGWGTPQPIALRDSEFCMVRLRGFGTYAFRVNDVSLFVNKVVGSQGLYTTNDVVDYLKSILLNAIAPAIANLKLSILDVPSNYAKIRAGVLALARDQFNDYGVELLDFNIESITPTDETAKAIDERAAMGAIGDMRAYLQFKAARALGDAAAKEAAPGADLTGAGLGLGAGIGLGGALAGAVSQAMQAGAGTGPAATCGSRWMMSWLPLRVGTSRPRRWGPSIASARAQWMSS